MLTESSVVGILVQHVRHVVSIRIQRPSGNGDRSLESMLLVLVLLLLMLLLKLLLMDLRLVLREKLSLMNL